MNKLIWSFRDPRYSLDLPINEIPTMALRAATFKGACGIIKRNNCGSVSPAHLLPNDIDIIEYYRGGQ